MRGANKLIWILSSTRKKYYGILPVKEERGGERKMHIHLLICAKSNTGRINQKLRLATCRQ